MIYFFHFLKKFYPIQILSFNSSVFNINITSICKLPYKYTFFNLPILVFYILHHLSVPSNHSFKPFFARNFYCQMLENHSSGAAPCQCFTSAGILMQSLVISTASFLLLDNILFLSNTYQDLSPHFCMMKYATFCIQVRMSH